MDREQRRRGKRGRALRRAAYVGRQQSGLDQAALDEAMATRQPPADDGARWVPIGPSVVRKGQAVDHPRVTGRIRDLAVAPTGRRAYAASAKGGVWYTGDGGATWASVDGGVVRAPGGPTNAQVCGCLLVAFGESAESDVVLVGTGEEIPVDNAFASSMGGVGVLAATGPVTGRPWARSGRGVFAGQALYRLVRDPSATPGGDGDTVLACSTAGAFLGERDGGYAWRPLVGRPACDAVWLPDGRLFVLLVDGALIEPGQSGEITLPMPADARREGIGSLAVAGPDRFYLLGEIVREEDKKPALWRIDARPGQQPRATRIAGVPKMLWGGQRDFDQALVVESRGDLDRVYLGGSGLDPGLRHGDHCAALYCFEVPARTGRRLAPVAGISRTGLTGGGAGAVHQGLIGNTLHPDVHVIRLAGPPARRQVWTGCDGGVFVSDRAGQVYSFRSANNGIAVLEPNFVRGHPRSSQLVAMGVQDNGTPVRSGDTTWELIQEGDGGGVVFVPTAPQVLIRQVYNAVWASALAKVVDPLQRAPRRPSFPERDGEFEDAECQASAFYSSAAVVTDPGFRPLRTRLAIGTNRVWLTDDIGLDEERANTWRVLPLERGRPADPRAGWTPKGRHHYDPDFGVPGLRGVVTMSWASTTELLVVYERGLVRYTEEDPENDIWSGQVLRAGVPPLPSDAILTDVGAVPGTRDFYLATTGVAGTGVETLWHHRDGEFRPTGLRDQLLPRDPVFAVVLDPADPAVVFAGTATGVWRGVRGDDNGHVWTEYTAGLPRAVVQDLSVWTAPEDEEEEDTADAPRLLRAALQSRGVWEIDLAHPARRHTWIRATAHDDRRRATAAAADPWPASDLAEYRSPAPDDEFTGSPDIVVRPRWTATGRPPRFAGEIPSDTDGYADFDDWFRRTPDHRLWTFQTAFRWLYPGVVANGLWTYTMDTMVALHRASLGSPAEPVIDKRLWDAVVRTRLTAAGDPTTDPSGTPAVFRAPWQTPLAPDAAPCEPDLTELVVPPAITADRIWVVYREPCTVDVLAHHRDAREVPAGEAAVTLLWRAGGRSPDELMELPVTGIADYLTGASPAVPGGWRAVSRRLAVPLGGHLPRGTSIDVDLSAAPAGRFALPLAYVTSTADDQPPLRPPVSPRDSVRELVRRWPQLAARVVKLTDRP
ncbi:hypothetical protein BJY16_008102 [Actinoplanes octamycinicus]|uniref:Uncharacterized protein n=1 Tax=Actinoplanes octamycinicus TaxID=135948 RepID=A0A7W7H5Y6_9ACTN|nr:hypothetical protein [Actinoplanes octamycinicus]MBB4744643.1 hypothetical protein [Actinoplanes octamycinicus]GIE55224.1 hypothetical protein Aoc01nite_06260 [Actinoplanes octamycinicus]